MKNRESMKEYPFPEPNEVNGYKIFPDSLEDDELIVFHGTNKSHLDSIIENNFRVQGELESISFSSTSSLALGYGCSKRTIDAPEGVVLAVKLESLNKPHVVAEGGIVHLYKPEQVPPTVIGFCLIPANYVFK